MEIGYIRENVKGLGEAREFVEAHLLPKAEKVDNGAVKICPLEYKELDLARN